MAMGILLVIALILPVAAAPPVQMINGGGWYIYPIDGVRVIKSFSAKIDAEGNVRGQWAVHGAPQYNSFHADVVDLIIIGNRAIIKGVVTSIPPGSEVALGAEICMVAVDNGHGKGVDQISETNEGWTSCDYLSEEQLHKYYGDIRIYG
jgi:hypothetical protein